MGRGGGGGAANEGYWAQGGIVCDVGQRGYNGKEVVCFAQDFKPGDLVGGFEMVHEGFRYHALGEVPAVVRHCGFLPKEDGR